MHCRSRFPRLAQLWKASSAIHWQNFVKHVLGREKHLPVNHSASLLLQIICQRKSFCIRLWSQTSSYNACSQATAARHVKRLHSYWQNVCVHTCWLMTDGCLCQLCLLVSQEEHDKSQGDHMPRAREQAPYFVGSQSWQPYTEWLIYSGLFTKQHLKTWHKSFISDGLEALKEYSSFLGMLERPADQEDVNNCGL